MNPHGAAACSNCGTRLTTTSATPSDKTTPADTPENITPFTPPELAQEDSSSAANDSAPPLARPSFSRSSSSSEWLKRVQKTPTTDAPATPSESPPFSPPPAANSAYMGSGSSDVPEWLREIQDEANRQATAPREIQEKANRQPPAPRELPAEPAKQSEPSPATPADVKPVLSEIKLTGDDYDYSDIGGQVTDEMKATLQAEATNVQSVEDEIALARKLLGLDMAAEAISSQASSAEFAAPSPAPAISEPAARIQTPPPAAPVLGEIKLTGDDYDYSDIGGQVTDEMKAALEAEASNTQSVDDEIALARRLLGLDVAAEAVAAHADITPAQAIGEAALPVEAPPVAELQTEIETPAALESPIEPIAEMQAPATTEASAIAEAAPSAETLTPPVATSAAAAPVLSEIKLTGDDYDYSDIGGQVTDEMKAALEAQASSAQSVEDEIALARRLLGLDIAVESISQPSQTAAPVTEPTTSTLDTLPAVQEQAPELPIAAAAISHAAQDQEPQPTAAVQESIAPAAEQPVTETRIETPSTLPPAEPPAPAKPASLPLRGADMPEWLREIAPPGFAPPEIVDGDVVRPPLQADSEMPEWLREIAPNEGIPSGAPLATDAVLSALPELDEVERGDLPDWLREPVETPVAEAPEITAEESGQVGTPLELPDWFSGATPIGATPRDPFETIETTGPLAGVSGILPLAIAITEPHTLTTPTPTRSDGGRIFQTLLAEPLTPTSRVREPEKTKPLLTTSHLLYLMILLAALVPLFLGLDQSGIGLDATSSPTAAFYDQLSAVPANSTVLLAFEYSPGQGVELDPAARVIVNNLLARGVNIIALSSNENGPTIAQNILQRGAEAQPSLTSEVVNVGYIQGKDAGLRVLASGWLPASRADVNGIPWSASPLARSITSMQDLALTIIMVGEEAPLDVWMQQVGTRINTPIVAVNSAAIDPKTRTYVSTKQLQASVRGLTGAAELELLTNKAGQAVRTVDALSFVSLILAGIIIAANIVWFMKRGKVTK